MPKKHIIVCVTNDLIYDQRMHRICHSLSEEYSITLVGRRKHTTPFHHLFDSFQGVWLPCFFSRGKLFYLEYQIRLFLYLVFKKYDAIYAVDLDTIWGAYAATSLKGKKKIFDAHEYFTELPEVINRPLTKKVWEWTAKIWIPQSDLCLTVNSPLAQILHQKYDKHFHAIKNMPTKKEGPPTSLSPGSSRILLYQGVLNVGRGLEELISIMNELPRYQLWLVGEGDLSDHLRAMAAMSTSKDRIHFLGYKSPEELAFITPQAFVGFNLLSSDSANYYYSLANKFFDYVQAGIPQVSMNFPAYREYISEYAVGVLVEDLSAQSLHSAISDFENEAVYSKAVSACKQTVNQWSWERESPALMKAVAELFSQK